MTCLTQPSLPLVCVASRSHCWLMFSLMFIKTPRAFPTKQLSGWAADSSLHLCVGLFLLTCRSLHFLLLNLTRILSTHYSSALRSVWMAVRPSGVSATPSIIILSKFCCWHTLYLIFQIINEYVRIGLDPMICLYILASNWTLTADPFSLAIQSVLNQPHCCAHLVHTLIMLFPTGENNIYLNSNQKKMHANFH